MNSMKIDLLKLLRIKEQIQLKNQAMKVQKNKKINIKKFLMNNKIYKKKSSIKKQKVCY